MKEITKTQFITNTLWNTIATVATKVIGLVVSTILARIIVPEAYGLLSLSVIFIASFDFLANSINQGLIVVKDVKHTDYSTSMITNMGIAVVAYAIIFFLAPLFSSIYKSTEFTVVVRILALNLFVQAPANIISAKATIELKTKKMALAAAIASIVSGIVGVALAYMGAGIWALVAQTLSNSLINAILVLILVKFDFSIEFSVAKMKYYLIFGMHIAAANVINAINSNITTLIGGNVYTKTDIGYSSKGNSYPEIVGLYAFGSLNSMSMRTVASRQDDKESVKRAVRRIMAMAFYIVFPIMAGLFAVSDTLIPLWLTDVWVPCIPFFKIACIRFALNPIYSLSYTTLRGMGDNKTCTILTSVSAFLNITASVIITLLLRKSILFASCFGLVLLVINCVLAFVILSKKIGYSFIELIKDIIKPVIMSLIMVGAVIGVSFIPISTVLSLGLQIVVGLAVYFVISLVTKNEEFMFLLNLVTRRKKGGIE